MAHIIKRRNVLKATFAEDVSDQVGTMVTGNTETGITVTYQDSDNTLDFAVAYASASDQETATSTTTAVNPSIQQRHPSALKFWAAVGVSGGTPSLAQSYNVTSITDSGVGRLTVTIATDFSAADWFETLTIAEASFIPWYWVFSKAAGSTEVRCASQATAALADPGGYFVGGAGDQ